LQVWVSWNLLRGARVDRGKEDSHKKIGKSHHAFSAMKNESGRLVQTKTFSKKSKDITMAWRKNENVPCAVV
jgi:hypothetical protein